ncbi:MAG: response regulator [Solirubrobacteraceae bacterium]|nr:response regulator [Solirubrobacteraceae bacterium]
MNPRPIAIVVADDDEEDRELTRLAFDRGRLTNEVRFCVDGIDLLDYLYQRGRWAPPEDAPRPGAILLDLNMPRMDGREALKAIKSDPDLRSIPVVVLTSSKAEEDVLRSYDLGVNSFITKPVTLTGLTEVLEVWSKYWFQIVELPPPVHSGAEAR